jgi:allophanate hydrolase subunit 1
MTGARITFLGDACLSVAFDERIDPAINARCIALAAALERQRPAGVRDIVPGFHTVAVHFDPLQADRNVLAADVERAMEASGLAAEDAAAPVEIPVRYGGEGGSRCLALIRLESRWPPVRLASPASRRGFIPARRLEAGGSSAGRRSRCSIRHARRRRCSGRDSA